MSKKNKGKKKDDELEEEMRDNIILDIEILKNKIHLEEQRENQARIEFEEITKQTIERQNEIDANKNDEIKKIQINSNSLKSSENSHYSDIADQKSRIKDLDRQILDLQKTLKEKKEEFEAEEAERDATINTQRQLFEQMTVRFQRILENTANKWQERVKMGS